MESACKPGEGAIEAGGAGPTATVHVHEDQLLDNMAGSREILVEAGQVFLDEVGSMLESLEKTVASGDVGAIERAAHLIKGALLSMAATVAAQFAASIEKRARSGDGALEDLVQALIDEVDRVRPALVRIMNAAC